MLNFPRGPDSGDEGDNLASYTIEIDERRFQQILLNYQSNALKFARKGAAILISVVFIPGS